MSGAMGTGTDGKLFFQGSINQAVALATERGLPFLCLVVLPEDAASHSSSCSDGICVPIASPYQAALTQWKGNHAQLDLVLIQLVHGTPEYGLFTMVYPPCTGTTLYVIVEGTLCDSIPLGESSSSSSSSTHSTGILDEKRLDTALRLSSTAPPLSSHSIKCPIETCRLSIRLLDGEQIRHTFDASAPLAVVRQFLIQERPGALKDTPFIMGKFSPSNHYFTPQQEAQSLKELDLPPSYALVVNLPDEDQLAELAQAKARVQKAAFSTTTLSLPPSSKTATKTLAPNPTSGASSVKSQKEITDTSRNPVKPVDQDVNGHEFSSTSSTSSRPETCWLALRLVNGQMVRHPFPPTATLAEVRTFITKHNGSPAFHMTEPLRRTFTIRDEACSLLDLGLVPSGSITLIPAAHGGQLGGTRRSWIPSLPSLANVSLWLGGLTRRSLLQIPILFVKSLILPLLHGGAVDDEAMGLTDAGAGSTGSGGKKMPPPAPPGGGARAPTYNGNGSAQM